MSEDTDSPVYNLTPSGVTNAGHPSAVEWFPIRSFLDVLRDSLAWKWSWAENSDCKYVDLRVDMRTGECVIMNRHGKVIGMKGLARQSSKEPKA